MDARSEATISEPLRQAGIRTNIAYEITDALLDRMILPAAAECQTLPAVRTAICDILEEYRIEPTLGRVGGVA